MTSDEYPAPLLMTAAQAAERLGVSVTTVRRATRAGHLPCRRIGEWGIRYTLDDLEGWVEAIATRRHSPGRPSLISRSGRATLGSAEPPPSDLGVNGAAHQHGGERAGPLLP